MVHIMKPPGGATTMKTSSIVLLALTLFGCSGASFTATDPLATPDAGSAEAANVMAVVAADTGLMVASHESGSSSGGSSSSSSGGTDSSPAPEEAGEAPEADSPSSIVVPDAASSDAIATADAGSCTPGATQCASDTQVEVCSPSGHWETATTCPYACVSGNCGGSCVPGMCAVVNGGASNAYIMACKSSGTWGIGCPSGQACSAGGPTCVTL